MNTYYVDVLVNGTTRIINIEARSKFQAIINALNLMDRENLLHYRHQEGRWVCYGNNLFQFCVVNRHRLTPRLIAKSNTYIANARLCA